MNTNQIIRILQKNGFVRISQSGSYQKWKNYNTGHQVIVPFHKGKDLPIGKLYGIIKGSGIVKSQWQLESTFGESGSSGTSFNQGHQGSRQ